MTTMPLEFVGELLATGGQTTGFAVPEEVVTALGAGKRPKVVVTIGEHTWRTSIAPMGGRFLLGVSAANRAATGLAAGQTVTVAIAVDDTPRVVEVPSDLAEALAGSPEAAAGWARLSYSHQRAHVEALLSAKRAETRAARVLKTLGMLTG
jgi:hypothetical protein